MSDLDQKTLDTVRMTVAKTLADKGLLGKTASPDVVLAIRNALSDALKVSAPVKEGDLNVHSAWTLMSFSDKVLWFILKLFPAQSRALRNMFSGNPPGFLLEMPKKSLVVKYVYQDQRPLPHVDTEVSCAPNAC